MIFRRLTLIFILALAASVGLSFYNTAIATQGLEPGPGEHFSDHCREISDIGPEIIVDCEHFMIRMVGFYNPADRYSLEIRNTSTVTIQCIVWLTLGAEDTEEEVIRIIKPESGSEPLIIPKPYGYGMTCDKQGEL